MERLLTTGADSQRRVDSKQAMMADLVSVSFEPAAGLYPSARHIVFFCARKSATCEATRSVLGHGEVVSVFHRSRPRAKRR